MRVLITGISEPTGRAVARMLLAAGHDVIGLSDRPDRYLDPRVQLLTGGVGDREVWARAVEGCDSVVHLAPSSEAAIAAIAQSAGTRVVTAATAGEDVARIAGLRSAGVPFMLARTAPVASRRADADTRRTLGLLMRGGGQVLHTDDLERWLVEAATSDRTGVVDLAAPGTVSADEVRAMLRAAGIAPPRGGARLRMGSVEAAAGFDYGWTAADVVADMIRGVVGRTPTRAGFRTLRGRIPLPTNPIPACVPASDGGRLESVAPEGLAGEFDDLVDPRLPVHTATNTSEALPGPMTPLTIDLQMGALRVGNQAMGRMIALDGIALEQWSSRVTSVLGHHVYINPSIGVVAADTMPGWDEESIRKDAYGSIPAEISLTPFGKPPMPTGFAARRATFTAVSRVIATARHYREQAELINAASRSETLDAEQIHALSDEQLYARATLWRDRLHQAWSMASIGVMMTGAAAAIHERAKGGEAPVDLQRLESARTMLAVEHLAEFCRADPELRRIALTGDVQAARERSADFAAALDAELAAMGHRGPGECELINPTFSDRPAMLLTAAARAAERPAPERVTAPPATSRTARMAAGATVARERARAGVVRYTHGLRLALRERAARLVGTGDLKEVDDVFFLTFDEAFWATDLGDRVARRRAERERLQAIRMPDVIAGKWEPVVDDTILETGSALTGIGVCPGIVKGRVKRVLSPDDDIEPGDILVAAVTDTGHTAMFAYAAAVVTDIGGAVSHAAIVAREFGIPCVVDTKTATAALRDGQTIRVDGAAGTVTLLD